MKPSTFRPRRHVYVCANRRASDDPLGGGCGDRGERVFQAIERETRARGLAAAVWVTKTHCLGLCPKTGCAVATAPDARYLIEVEPDDVDAILTAAR